MLSKILTLKRGKNVLGVNSRARAVTLFHCSTYSIDWMALTFILNLSFSACKPKQCFLMIFEGCHKNQQNIPLEVLTHNLRCY